MDFSGKSLYKSLLLSSLRLWQTLPAEITSIVSFLFVFIRRDIVVSPVVTQLGAQEIRPLHLEEEVIEACGPSAEPEWRDGWRTGKTNR